jgi:uncharacterized protein (DUF433 family)
MNLKRPPARRRRLSVDLPVESETAIRALAERYFGGVTTDAIRTSLSFLSWAIDARRHGRRVVAVSADQLPSQFEEPVLPGIQEQLATDWQWLIARPHPWRRQLWLKGRRITAGDLARTIEIEGWTPEHARDEFDLPLDAVLEAQRYAASNRDLILAEERENEIAAREAIH